MARMVKIGLGQVAWGWPEGGPAEVRAHHKRAMEPMLRKAGEEGADVVCFSECAMTRGIKLGPEAKDVWQDVAEGADAEWAAGQARRWNMNLIMPTTGFSGGELKNVAVVFDRKGEVVGVYEKVHRGRVEAMRIAGGGGWPVFKLDVGVVGVMICHDMHFPESSRCLALNGAEIIFWPTHFGGMWGDDYLMAIMRASAIYNGVYFANVSVAPREGEAWLANMQLARTGLIGPRGEWRFRAGFGVGMAVGEVDLEERLDRPWFGCDLRDEYRKEFLADRRPETYGVICQRPVESSPR